MVKDNILVIKKRAGIIHKLIKAIFVTGLLVLFATLLLIAYLAFFTSPERFSATRDNSNWSLAYNLVNGSSFFVHIPFKLIQPLDSNMFIAKNAVITSLFSILFKGSLILYGINQILSILKSTAIDKTPFIISNVGSLKKLAFSIILYSALADILSSLIFSAFVTRIFYLDFSNIHLSGILIGGLILVIADIFKYGVFLQNEFDTTL